MSSVIYSGTMDQYFRRCADENARERELYRIQRLEALPACDMPDGCGARAGETCEAGCPSLATLEAAADVR